MRLTPGTLPKLGKAAVLTVAANASAAGTFTARATIDAKTAKKLGLGRKAATIGTGKATLAAAGTAKLKIKLTPKAKARLRRARSTVSVVVKVTFKPVAGGGSTRTLKLRLKP